MSPDSALTRRWTQTTAGLMHARASGDLSGHDRALVLLVHGLVISSRYMVPTAVALAPLCPVAALDLPGTATAPSLGHSSGSTAWRTP
jgi:2-hydroxy-6-oxonona-2,4-dienedioate hydrolase